MLTKIRTRFARACLVCNKQLEVGAIIWYSKPAYSRAGVFCEQCGASQQQTVRPVPAPLQAASKVSFAAPVATFANPTGCQVIIGCDKRYGSWQYLAWKSGKIVAHAYGLASADAAIAHMLSNPEVPLDADMLIHDAPE
jgi:hypothetical protein